MIFGVLFIVEIFMVIAAISFMAKVADAEDRSGLKWGGLTLLLCIGAFWIPLPLVRMAIACFVSFVALIVAKMIRP